MVAKAIMTYSEAPIERISNAQNLVNDTEGVPFIGGRNLCLNFRNLFNQYQGNPLLILEDDVTVCKDFVNKAEDIISRKPDFVINFFFPALNRYKGLHKMSGLHYSYNQCTYFPSWFLDAYLDNYSKLIKDYEDDYKHNDSASLISDLIKVYQEDFYAYFPYLVKTNKYKSTLNHRLDPAQNRYFIDDYKG